MKTKFQDFIFSDPMWHTNGLRDISNEKDATRRTKDTRIDGKHIKSHYDLWIKSLSKSSISSFGMRVD